MSEVWCLLSEVWFQTSVVGHLISDIWYQVFDVCCLMSGVRRLLSDVRHLMFVVWCHTSDIWCLMFVVWCLYIRQQTSDVWCQTSVVWHLKAVVRLGFGWVGQGIKNRENHGHRGSTAWPGRSWPGPKLKRQSKNINAGMSKVAATGKIGCLLG